METKKITYSAGFAVAALGTIIAIRHQDTPDPSPLVVPPSRDGKSAKMPHLKSRQVAAPSGKPSLAVGEATEPLNPAWLSKYRVPISQLDADANGDGTSNRGHMLAGTDPFDGKSSPYQYAPRLPKDLSEITGEVAQPAWEQRRADFARLVETSKEEDARMEKNISGRAQAMGLNSLLGDPRNPSARLNGFDPDGNPIYMQDSNIALADTSGIDELWPAGSVTAVPGWTTGSTGWNLSGAGQTIAMWESLGGVMTDHTQFGARGMQVDLAAPVNGHASAVGGALASSGATFEAFGLDFGNHSRGAAYGANLNSFRTDAFSSEFLGEAFDGRSLANLSIETSSGWSEIDGNWTWFGNAANLESHLFGNYLDGTNSEPRRVDNLVNSTRTLLPVISASNNRGSGAGEGPGTPSGTFGYYLGDGTYSTAPRNWVDGDAGGYDTLSPNAVTKNALVVGACYDIADGYTAPADVIIAPFSAFGPTDDGRIKPDIVAAGIRNTASPKNVLGLEEAVEVGFDPLDPTYPDSYSILTGTSLSAPIVTGGLSLVLERRNQLRADWAGNEWPIQASTLRALAVHTADEAGAAPGPDFQFGYGLFNAVTSAQVMTAECAATNKPHIKEIYIPAFAGTSTFKISAVNSAKPLKVTLAWSDLPGAASPSGTVDPTTKRLIQNLDLSVTNPSPSSTVNRPWVLKPDLALKSAITRASAATRGIDSINNLEQVQIDSPTTTGQYTVTVSSPGTGLTTGQWVSVVLTNDAVPAVDFRVTEFTRYDSEYYYLEWNSVPGGIYRVEGTSDLVNWYDATGDISARSDSASQLVTGAGAPMYFWRVVRLY